MVNSYSYVYSTKLEQTLYAVYAAFVEFNGFEMDRDGEWICVFCDAGDWFDPEDLEHADNCIWPIMDEIFTGREQNFTDSQ